jgi:hypothetical protein
MANTHDSTPSIVTALPAPTERPYPTDPDTALALIKIGRHLASVDKKLELMFRTPGGPKFLPAVRELVEDLIELLSMDLPDPDLEDDDPGEETGDAEPSLGSTQMINQERWSEGQRATEWDADRELDDADKEDNGDAEPEETDDDQIGQ